MRSAGLAAQVRDAETSVSRFLSHLGCSKPVCNVDIKTPKFPRAEAPGRFRFLALAWMNPQYTPGRVSSYILGKDEVTGSNPVISSRNQSEMAGFFVVWGWISQEWARHPAFLLTSILPGRGLYELRLIIRFTAQGLNEVFGIFLLRIPGDPALYPANFDLSANLLCLGHLKSS